MEAGVTSFVPKVRFYPEFMTGQPTIGARPMTPEEQECDCGCMEYESDPAADLTFYAEPQHPKPAGVSPGYLVIRRGGSAEVANMAMLHDGEGNAVGQIDHSTWRHAEIVED
jgi:hypothetical protein